MNQEIAEQWVAALRSGKYKQNRASLRRGDKFCCLGVLCNLHAIAHPEVAAQQKSRRYYLGEGTYLPKQVQQWAGMRTKDGADLASAFSPTTSLAALNDCGQSFTQLAKTIEENVDAL